MKRAFWLLAAAAIAGTAAYFYNQSAKRKAEQANFMKLSGNIEAHESLVSFKVTGRLVDLPVEEGQMLKAGDLIARLDSADYSQQVAMDQASVLVRQRELALGLAGYRPQDIQAGRLAVLNAKADLDEKKRDLARYQALYAKDEIAGQVRDQAATAVTMAQATYDRAEQAYSELLEGTRKEDLAVDRADVRQAQQTLDMARILLSYTVLRAPFAGVILVRQAELGEVMQPGAPVITLADLAHIWVRVYVPETDLGRVRWGENVTVQTDTYPGKQYHGRISFISSEAEFTPKSVQTEQERVTLVYRVKVDVDNPNFELKPGMPADVYVPLK
jgi:HlyD family secretion protein